MCTEKVEPFMTDIKANFLKHFEPHRRLSIDEAWVKHKGRLGIIQHMPLKPHKTGIKLWMLCVSQLEYILNFDVYSSENNKMKRSGKKIELRRSVLHDRTPKKAWTRSVF